MFNSEIDLLKGKNQKEWEERTSAHNKNQIDLSAFIFNPNNNAKDLVDKNIKADFLKSQGYDIGKFDENYRKNGNWTVENLVSLQIIGDSYTKLGFTYDNFFKFHRELSSVKSLVNLGIVGSLLYELGFTFDNFFKNSRMYWEAIDYMALQFNGPLFKRLGFTFDNFFQHHSDWTADNYKILEITKDNFPDNLNVDTLIEKGFCTDLIDIILYSKENSKLPEALRYGVIEDKQRSVMEELGDSNLVQELQLQFENAMKPILEKNRFFRIIKACEIESFIREGKLSSYFTNNRNDEYIDYRLKTVEELGLYINSNDIGKEEKSGISRREAIMKRMHICGFVDDRPKFLGEYDYGDAIIEINPEAVKHQTTFTFGDSLLSESTASKVTNPNIATLMQHKNRRGIVRYGVRDTAFLFIFLQTDSISRIKDRFQIPYIELQFHGEIPFNSHYINAVHMNKDNYERFKDVLMKLGIPCYLSF